MPVHNLDSFLKIAQTAQHAATEVRSIFIDITLAIFCQRSNCWKAWNVSRSTTTCRYDKYRLTYKNIIWHFQQIATFICRLYGDVTTTVTDRTVLRNRRLQTLVEACKRLEPEWLPSTNRAAHFHASSSSDSILDIVGRRRTKPHWIRMGKCRPWTISNYEGFSTSPRLHLTI